MGTAVGMVAAGRSSEPAGPWAGSGTAGGGVAGGVWAIVVGAAAFAALAASEAPSAEPDPFSAADSPSAVSMTAISALLGTVAPSSTRISVSVPSNGDGTSALTLSVMTSRSGSYLAT